MTISVSLYCGADFGMTAAGTTQQTKQTELGHE